MLNGGSRMTQMNRFKATKKRDCAFYFMKLDYEILKPLLIYKYQYDEMHKQDDLI